MKKVLIAIMILTCIPLVSCGRKAKIEKLDNQISAKRIEVQDLENKIIQLKSTVQEIAPEDHKRYILKLIIKQDRISFSIKDNVKDTLNKVEFDIAVDKKYYNSVEEGQEVLDEFRAGSFLTSGSVGSWKIIVKEKRIEVE